MTNLNFSLILKFIEIFITEINTPKIGLIHIFCLNFMTKGLFHSFMTKVLCHSFMPKGLSHSFMTKTIPHKSA